MLNKRPGLIRKVYFYCQKVLPLVYDDSLSYYEVLCKVADKLNEIIETSNQQTEQIKDIQEVLEQIQDWINNFDTSVIEKILQDQLAKMIFVGISDAGYIVYHIPQSWNEIQFHTTGLDIDIPLFPEYGHLVLSVWGVQPMTEIEQN